MHTPAPIALAALVALTACAGERAAAPAGEPAQRIVDISTARRLVAQGIKVVDVRTPEEFATGHVPGAVNIPFDEMEKRHAELGPPSTPVLLYCRSGRRSGIAGELLTAKGFDQVFDFRLYDLWVQSERQ